jgi:hypothetical protein
MVLNRQKTVVIDSNTIIIENTGVAPTSTGQHKYVFSVCNIKSVEPMYFPNYRALPNSGYHWNDLLKLTINFTDGQGNVARLDFDIQDVTNQAAWTPNLAGLINAVTDIQTAIKENCGSESSTSNTYMVEMISGLQAIEAKLPVLGYSHGNSAAPVNLSKKLPVDSPNITAVNTDLLTNVVNGWFDVRDFNSFSVSIIGSAGISAGAIIFEQTNDNTITTGIPWPVFEESVLNSNPNTAAITIAANSNRVFTGAVQSRFVRIRVSTGFTGGNVRANATFSQVPWNSTRLNVQQATGANLNVTAAAITLASNQVITNVPQTGQGASTTFHLISAASTNATVVKGSAGVINELTLSNNSAVNPAYVKLYNRTTAPTVGTDTPVRTIMIPPNGTVAVTGGSFGFRFATGIAIAITGGIANSDATAVTANQVSVGISYT